jgi:hypothetical protein
MGLMFLSLSAYAKDPNPHQLGRISETRAVPCSAKRGNTTRSICQEYFLESENVVYQIRPRDRKHAIALQTGDRTEFRLNNGVMLLRTEGIRSKERAFVVISVSPVSETSAADVRSMRVNHLQ